MSLRASLIVCTCDRAALLEDLLPALAEQCEADFEVVVVNGPSKDHTEAVLSAWKGRIKTASCPVRNVSRSRNRGVAKAAGDWLVFLDDDARPCDARWLHRILSDVATHPRAGVWGGPVLHRDTSAREFDGGWMSDYGFHRFRTEDPEPAPGQFWRRALCGTNMAFRADALREAGGFDGQFVYYAEETDLSWRLQDAGWDALFSTDNPVRHYPRRPPDLGAILLVRNWRTIARSDMYFSLRHGRNALPVRGIRALARAPRKHYLQELHDARRRGLVTPAQWRSAVLQCARGALAGLAAAFVPGPRLERFAERAPDFLPFPGSSPAPRSGPA
jgi:hypothetical protein